MTWTEWTLLNERSKMTGGPEAKVERNRETFVTLTRTRLGEGRTKKRRHMLIDVIYLLVCLSTSIRTYRKYFHIDILYIYTKYMHISI